MNDRKENPGAEGLRREEPLRYIPYPALNARIMVSLKWGFLD